MYENFLTIKSSGINLNISQFSNIEHLRSLQVGSDQVDVGILFALVSSTDFNRKKIILITTF